MQINVDHIAIDQFPSNHGFTDFSFSPKFRFTNFHWYKKAHQNLHVLYMAT